MPGFKAFDFVADGSFEKETAPITLGVGELVVVRFQERVEPASVFLKITNNSFPTMEPIVGTDAYPTGGLLSGTTVSVVVRFNTSTLAKAKGIIEVGN